MDGWMDGWMDGRTDERMDGWMDGCLPAAGDCSGCNNLLFQCIPTREQSGKWRPGFERHYVSLQAVRLRYFSDLVHGMLKDTSRELLDRAAAIRGAW